MSKTNLKASGRYIVEHYRDGEKINEYQFNNGTTNEGLDSILNVMFHGTTAITAWYLGIIDGTGYTALAATDTYATINQAGNGWDEFADYTDPGNSDSATTRPAWTEGAASSQSIANGTVVVFDITDTGTIKGMFLVGGGTTPSTKSDFEGGGTLWSTALFTGGDVSVQNTDEIRVTYTISMS
jgi:hypothetical protein